MGSKIGTDASSQGLGCLLDVFEGSSGGIQKISSKMDVVDSDDESFVSDDDVQLSPLHEAVEAGDLPRVQALVAAGADIEEKQNMRDAHDGVHKATPLYRAAYRGHVSVARYLIERGANKEADGGSRWTSIHVAARFGHVEVVRMLIEHGTSKDAASTGGWTALMHACACGHVAVAEYLLEQGCDIDHATTSGYTALHYAAMCNRLEVAQLLLRFGAKLDVRDDQGRTPADIATQYRHQRIADAIRAEEIRRRDHGFKRDRSTIEGTEEHAASKRPRAEREAEEAAVLAAAAAVDESDDDDDDDEDDDDEEDDEDGR